MLLLMLLASTVACGNKKRRENTDLEKNAVDALSNRDMFEHDRPINWNRNDP